MNHCAAASDTTRKERRERLRRALFWLPIALMLPASVLFLVLDASLAAAAGGRETEEFFDAAVRWGMGGGLLPFFLVTLAGMLVWLVALAVWIVMVVRDRRPHLGEALLLVLGIASHMRVVVFLWELGG